MSEEIIVHKAIGFFDPISDCDRCFAKMNEEKLEVFICPRCYSSERSVFVLDKSGLYSLDEEGEEE